MDGTLTKRLANAKLELGSIIADAQHHPITYDPSYTSVVQSTKHEKLSRKLDVLVKKSESAFEGSQLDRAKFQSSQDTLFESDMDKTSAEDALDSQQAYYKEEVNYFINTVTKQVIELHLLRELAEDTFSPMIVHDMSDTEVAFVAAEPEETTRDREFLEGRKATLEKGQKTFKSALGLFK